MSRATGAALLSCLLQVPWPGRLTVSNLRTDSLQADMAIMQALRDAGCRLTVNGGGVMAGEV
ncbi:MAG: hypothetical protein MZV63_07615 [Marinilabiliales bacterium]|nr:hypothetical protein [Marinilabiliales bacterium]